MASDPMLPVPYRVIDRRVETADSATLTLEPVGAPVGAFGAGQFTMLCVPGVGEIAVSISGDPSRRDGTLQHTVRNVGAVSRAIHDASLSSVLGVRGPLGVGWGVASAAGSDVVVVAGGVGLAPLRSLVLAILADRDAFGRVVLVVGARRPAEFLFAGELESWRSR